MSLRSYKFAKWIILFKDYGSNIFCWWIANLMENVRNIRNESKRLFEDETDEYLFHDSTEN
jgi:hypothetical protein